MSKLAAQMRCVELVNYGDVSNLQITNTAIPEVKDNEVLIKVRYAGVNRPDILHRKGIYKPPKGASPILGLEVAGEVVKKGKQVKGITLGSNVCALVPGGGYAQYCVTHYKHCLRIPGKIDFKEAASLPETFFTVAYNLCILNKISNKKSILIHGGTSGIGITTIQFAKFWNMKVFTTVRNNAKKKFCQELGADLVINYQEEDFVIEVLNYTDKQGVDVVVDFVGGDYIAKNLEVLAVNGRYIFLAFLTGSKVNLDLLPVLYKNITITGSTIRRQSTATKTKIATVVKKKFMPFVKSQKFKPIIYKVFPLTKVKDAHLLMESNEHIGKIVLKVK